MSRLSGVIFTGQNDRRFRHNDCGQFACPLGRGACNKTFVALFRVKKFPHAGFAAFGHLLLSKSSVYGQRFVHVS